MNRKIDYLISMSTEPLKNMEADIEGPHTPNDERREAPSSDGSYDTVTDRLPSWREFAEGISTSSNSDEWTVSTNLDELTNGRHLMHLPSILHKTPELELTSKSDVVPSLPTLPSQIPLQLPGVVPSISTTNLNTSPLVDVVDLTTVPLNVPPAYFNAHKCDICGRIIASDIGRHIRTHDKEGRFKCFYPRGHCSHKSGYFHRQYDFKKHLLHDHFVLHNSSVKRLKNLTDKLDNEGTCRCGKRMKAGEWLNHIMARDADGSFECPDLREKVA